MFIVTAEQRCLHTSIVANTAMSKFDQKSPMPYEKLVKNLEVVKSRLNRPMTLSEKILYSHLDNATSPVYSQESSGDTSGYTQQLNYLLQVK